MNIRKPIEEEKLKASKKKMKKNKKNFIAIEDIKENVRKRKIEDHIVEKDAMIKIKRVELEDKKL